MNAGATYMVRLATEADLLGGLEDFVRENGIQGGWITYLGAVRSASLRYYDQAEQEYCDFHIHRPLEVLAGTGNISLLDGDPFIHTHAQFADEQGRGFGGHVNYGCEVWAIEARIEVVTGDIPIREFDERTGLHLWGGNLPEDAGS